ncbi:MAG: ATP-binding cassette domain-containing protein [Ilumatobacteraceae bacterium]
MVLLRCDGLVRRFGDRVAVDGVSFEIAAGETYGLLGPNGAGKTTTISMIVGVLDPHGGTVEIDGHRVGGHSPEAKRCLGLVHRRSRCSTTSAPRRTCGSSAGCRACAERN